MSTSYDEWLVRVFQKEYETITGRRRLTRAEVKKIATNLFLYNWGNPEKGDPMPVTKKLAKKRTVKRATVATKKKKSRK